MCEITITSLLYLLSFGGRLPLTNTSDPVLKFYPVHVLCLFWSAKFRFHQTRSAKLQQNSVTHSHGQFATVDEEVLMFKAVMTTANHRNTLEM